MNILRWGWIDMSNKMIINQRHGWLGWWPRGGVQAILDPENGRIKAFLEEQRYALAENAKVLDAGAGRLSVCC